MSLPVTAELEQEASQFFSSASWRLSAAAPEAAPRILWHALKGSDLGDFGGPVAKFDANLAAIDLLRHLIS